MRHYLQAYVSLLDCFAMKFTFYTPKIAPHPDGWYRELNQLLRLIGWSSWLEKKTGF